MPGWTPPELSRVVGRGPARARCLEVVEIVLAAQQACDERPLAEQLEARPFGFGAEGLGLARGLAGRPDPEAISGLDRVFFHVGLGMARGFGASLPWPPRPYALLQADGLGFASALHRPGRALRLSPPEGVDPRWFAHGVGRASWFIAGGSPTCMPSLLAELRPGLMEGLGLASVFTGGAPREAMAALGVRAGAARSQLELGQAFGRWLRSPHEALPQGFYGVFSEFPGA